ncbi:FUSC family protein [Variovorax sp.]|uniref:FUSC family protein n=1 Tax=Variovorax sp. TaxID=1871043 RepID=UPI002D5F784D|nr:FUSC family protein [Variovorax sp.]HYP85988.1 FUSC family protein [Variovorax sp.]
MNTLRAERWLAQLDPGGSACLFGIRLILGYALGACLAAPTARWLGWRFDAHVPLDLMAGGIALWALVSETAPTRAQASRQILALGLAACAGAALFAACTPALTPRFAHAPELLLATGAFVVAYLRRSTPLRAGMGSQFYIGEIFVYGVGAQHVDAHMVVLLGVVGTVSALAARLVASPAPGLALLHAPQQEAPWPVPERMRMGLQATLGALAIVALDAMLQLEQAGWAITGCIYVIAGSRSDTFLRGRQRMLGNCVGVLAGLAALPLAEHLPWLGWSFAAAAMMLFAWSNALRYDIACAAYAFTLVLTLAAHGEHSVALLASRAWETLLGSALALLFAHVVLPLERK